MGDRTPSQRDDPEGIGAPVAFRRPVAVTRLRAGGVPVSEQATEAELEEIARLLALNRLEALEIAGRLEPYRRGGWRLTARVRARYEQICAVSLDPAPGSLDEEIERLWLPDAELAREAARLAVEDVLIDPTLEEEPEPLGAAVDPAAAALETLALALDPYPRAPGAALERSEAAPPGAGPFETPEERPFAALGALKARMAAEPDGEGGDETP